MSANNPNRDKNEKPESAQHDKDPNRKTHTGGSVGGTYDEDEAARRGGGDQNKKGDAY